jgi:dienelactone hydrolase
MAFENVSREVVRFRSETEECHAWRYLPLGAARDRPVPMVVLAHGLGGVKGLGLDAYAQRFCAAGYACLVFDYRHFGESGGEPRHLLSVRRQRADWWAAVGAARTMPEVDPTRIVLWGTSFAGGHVLVTAARDPCVAAAVVQCPFTTFYASWLAIEPRSGAKLAARVALDVGAHVLGRPPVLVRGWGRPGEAAAMTAPDVVAGVEALVAASGVTNLPDAIPARGLLSMVGDVPGRRAQDVRCPVLFCICRNDTVAPAAPTARYALRAPRSRIALYDCGHFDIYLGEPFEQAVADQLAFLQEHVPVMRS